MNWALLLCLILNAALWGGVLLAVRACRPRWSALDAVLAAAVVGFVLIVLGMESLSFVGGIGTPGAAAISGLALLSGATLRARHKMPAAQEEASSPAARPTIDSQLSTLNSRHSFNFQLSTFNFLSTFNLSATAALLLATWAALYYLLRGTVLPVETVSDAPIYHLYFAVQWWKAGQLEFVPTPFGELAATYFPANGDVWLAWLVAVSGSERPAKVGQWPFLVLAAAAVYGLGRLVGAGRSAAVLPAAIWVSVPAVLVFSGVANVDLIYTAFYLIAVYFVLRYWRQREPATLALFALACGTALGTKAAGFVFAAPIVFVALIAALRSGRRAGHLALLAAGGALPCIYWFARNAYATGNPLYPLHVELFGQTVFSGWYDRSAMLESGYHLPPTEWRALVDRLSAVVDLRLLWLWPIALLFGLAVAIARRGEQQSGVVCPRSRGHGTLTAGALSVLSLIYGVIYWFVVPYNTQERFLLPALAIGLVPLALLLEKRPPLQSIVAALLAWHLLTPVWQTQLILPAPQTGSTLLPLDRGLLTKEGAPFALALPVSLAAAWIVCYRGGLRRLALAGTIVAGGCLVTAWPAIARMTSEPLLRFYPAWGFARELFPAWAALERASGPGGARVAYAGTNLPYYLFGRGLRNEVRYVNVNRHADWRPHDYHLDRLRRGEAELAPDPWPAWYREAPDYEAWLSNLRAAGIEFLLVARENRHGRRDTGNRPAPFPIEQQWAQQNPEAFEAVDLPFASGSEVPWAWLYRVVRP